MMAIPHIGFILAAYAVTTVVMAGTAGAILLDHRTLKRALARLEAQTERCRGPRR